MPLKEQIEFSIKSGNAKIQDIAINEHNIIKYTYIININGVNQKRASVIVVYGIGKFDSQPRLITNYIYKERQNGKL